MGFVFDREMQFLLRMFADGCWILLPEINLVISYLTERWDKMQSSPNYDSAGQNAFMPKVVKMDSPDKLKANTCVVLKELLDL